MNSNRLAALALGLACAGCATHAPSPDAFTFAVIGDTPYSAAEEKPWREMIAKLNAQPLDFVIHVGDIKAGGNSPCTVELLRKRRAEFDTFTHPLFYTPGDNEWTDCRRKSNGGFDPLERLDRLRVIFFGEPFSLGANRMPREMGTGSCFVYVGDKVKCTGYPENSRWVHGGVVFATLNVPGSNNNSGFDAASDREYADRMRANLAWLAAAVEEAARADRRALVVAIQADPWLESKDHAFDALIAALVRAATRLRKPVLFVHGDTHIYRMDRPFTGPGGEPVPNLVRMETYGSPMVGWVKVRVDPDDPELFRFDPNLVALVPGKRGD